MADSRSTPGSRRLDFEEIEKWREKCLSLWLVNCTIKESHEQANALCDMALASLTLGVPPGEDTALSETVAPVADWYREHTEAELRREYQSATDHDAPEHIRGEPFEKWADAEGYVRGSTLQAAPSAIDAPSEDAHRMDWLEMQSVEVRTPLRHGSRQCLLATPDFCDGQDEPSTLRKLIDVEMSK